MLILTVDNLHFSPSFGKNLDNFFRRAFQIISGTFLTEYILQIKENLHIIIQGVSTFTQEVILTVVFESIEHECRLNGAFRNVLFVKYRLRIYHERYVL